MSNEEFFLMTLLVIGLNLGFFIIPFTIIIRRMGFSGWWMLLFLVPFGVLVGIWLMALVRWPAVPRNSN
jgi:hypothetical protein